MIPEKLIEEKKRIRRECRARRMAQSEEQIRDASHSLCSHILAADAYRNAECVIVYIETQKEISLDEVIRRAWNDKKQVLAPRCQGKEMNFFEICSYEDLEDGYFGVREPKQYCMEVVPAPEKTLFLAPGVAFDNNGRRTGYGGGFYDRYLAKYPGFRPVGVAFSFQIYPEIPCEETDIPMSAVVTENGFIKSL